MSETNDLNRILTRVLGSDKVPLPLEVARFLLGLSLTQEDYDRIADLSEKANEGDLTPREREELSIYVTTVDVLAIVQSKARITVKWTEAELLKGVTPEAVGGEIDWGGPVGKEVW